MKCGCEARWEDVDLWCEKPPYCPIHNTYEIEDGSEFYNDELAATQKKNIENKIAEMRDKQGEGIIDIRNFLNKGIEYPTHMKKNPSNE